MILNSTAGTSASVSVPVPEASPTPTDSNSTTTPLFSRTDSSKTQDTAITRPDESSAAGGSNDTNKSPTAGGGAGVGVGAAWSPITTSSSSSKTPNSSSQHRHHHHQQRHSSGSNSSVTPKVVYGAGTISRLPTELGKLGLSAPLIVSSPSRISLARRVQALIPNLDTRILDSALVNVPKQVVEDAVARVSGRDSVISVGGASAMRLAKAIALRKQIPHICIPTSYSGSESPLLGDVRRRKSRDLVSRQQVRSGGNGTSTTSSKSYSEDDTQTMPQMIIYDEDLACTGTSMTISAPNEAKAPAHGRTPLDDDAQWSYIHLPGV